MTPTPSATEARRWTTATGACAVLFAVAASWSIAASQAAIMAGALLLVARALLRRQTFRLPPTLLAVLWFLLTQAISIPFSVHPSRSLLLWKDSWIFLFPIVFVGLLEDDRWRARALAAFAGSGTLVAILAILQHFVGVDWLHGNRPLENYGGGGFVAVGAYGHLTFSGVLLSVLFVTAGLYLAERRPAWGAATILCALGLLFGFARTAWIGLAFGLVVLAGLLRGRRAILGVAAALIVLVAAAAVAEPALRRRMLSILELGSDPRARLWQTSWRIFADHPWVGAGLGSFKTQFPLYRVPGEYMSTIHPHSDILNHLVETGLLGASAWIAIWVAFFYETRGRRSPLLQAMRAGVAALLVAGLGQCYSTDEEPAQAWWFLVAAALWTARSAPAKEATPLRPVGARRRTPWRSFTRRFKQTSLPLAARVLAPRRSAPPRAARFLLVRQDNRLGNVLLLTPTLRRMREALPQAHLAFLSGEAYGPLLHGSPWIDEWIVQPKRRHASFPPLFLPWIAAVRSRRWDAAFELSNHNTHSYYNCLLTLAAGAPERIGFDHPRSRPALTRRVPAPDPKLHFSLAPLHLLRALGFPAEPAEMELPPPPSPSAGFQRWTASEGLVARPVVLHLGGREAKAWPLEAWTALLPRVVERTEAPIVLVAGAEDQDRLDRLAREIGPRVRRAPLLSLTDLRHLLRGAAAFVGCDSGVMHLAVASGTPTVALFFRSNPYHYAPLGRRHATVLLADPYGVPEAEWARTLEGVPRSTLHRALPAEAEASRLGRPETGPRAIAAVEAALREILVRPEHPPDTNPAAPGRRMQA